MSDSNNVIKMSLAMRGKRKEEMQKWVKEYDKRDIAPVCMVGVDISGKFYTNFSESMSRKDLAQILVNIGTQMASDAFTKVD